MLMNLSELLHLVRREPLTLLTSRRVGSLALFLSGRDLALGRMGIGEWSDVPIAERVEQHYGVSIMPWRSWIDVVESFAADEWDAFDRFLELALSWDDPMTPAPPATTAAPPLAALLDEIAARPAMFLGDKSIFRLADFLRGYTHTIVSAAAAGGHSDEVAALERFYGELIAQRQDHRRRPWFKLLRFYAHSDEAAFDEFFKQWRQHSGGASAG